MKPGHLGALAGVALAALAASALLPGPLAQGAGQAPADTAPALSNAALPAGSAVATFAGGCFWCVEADFDKLPGVLSTTSGYTGGQTVNPSYEQVSSHRTGHAEVVQIVFDPARIGYAQLVEHFWRTIDPTTVDRQFCDRGSPYRTAIYTHDAAQAAVVQASLAALQRSKPFAEPIVTQVRPAGPFYAAEAYHQDYYLKNPVRYGYYRSRCGRDARLDQLWGPQRLKASVSSAAAGSAPPSR